LVEYIPANGRQNVASGKHILRQAEENGLGAKGSGNFSSPREEYIGKMILTHSVIFSD
jgi:hypothetical protein